MSNLNKRISSIQSKSRPQTAKDYTVPEYGEHGEIVRKAVKIPKWILWFVGIIGLIFAILYIPSIPYIFEEEVADGTPVTVDSSMIRVANEYMRDAPALDFDGDGLYNELELQYGTNAYKADTDKDGINDYSELFENNTNPLSANSDFVTFVKDSATKAGKSAGTPYKMNDVVMWPDNWNSRAYGTVVRTVNGYRFNNFSGWAQFPFEEVYAYKVENGRHVILQYKENEKAWKITDDKEVFLYTKPLKTYYEIKILNKNAVYINEEEGWKGVLQKIADFIIPNQSLLISARAVTALDAVDQTKVLVQNEITPCSLDYPINRFSKNMNSLSDLANVYSVLRNGYCMLMSFYIENAGEAVLEVYGYDSNGGLLVCDPVTLETMGTIHIIERASKYLDANNEVVANEWFSFYGCGIDSRNTNVQIRFFNSNEPVEEPVVETPVVEQEQKPVLNGPGTMDRTQDQFSRVISRVNSQVNRSI